MNVSKRQNEFYDIPGFDASRGERILKALQKLWAKIQYLEQNRMSEKSESSCSSKNEDLTITDVQYKLLLLQLQYVRSLLKKKSGVNTDIFQNKINQDEKCILSTNDKNITRQKDKKLHSCIANKPPSEEMSTIDNSSVGLNSAKESAIAESNSKDVKIASDYQLLKYASGGSSAIYQSTIPSSSRPHYHLKLGDVPFILGASSTDSHSVIANVQNIIAKMKLHNKALCGPKPNITRSATANIHSADLTVKNSTGERTKCNSTGSTFANTHSIDSIEKHSTAENSQDVTKMLNDLCKGVSELKEKQQKLAESLDASQIKHGPEINSAKSIRSCGSKINYKQVENKTHRSHSESEVKLHAEIKKMPKMKEKDCVKHVVHPKQSASNIRPQPSNLSLMDRRKLLRSLQDFKKHLSEEDITWN